MWNILKIRTAYGVRRTALAVAICLIAGCGGGGSTRDTTDVSVQPDYPENMQAMSANLKAVGTIYASEEIGADVLAQPVLGDLNNDGSFTFKLTLNSSLPASGGFFQADFYYAENNTGLSLRASSSEAWQSHVLPAKSLTDELEGSIRVAYITQTILDSEGASFTVTAEDFFTNPDDDSDGLPNLNEVNSGLDPNNADTDGDGVIDGLDIFPSASLEWNDTDGDGIGDNTDDDIDGDGLANDDEDLFATNKFDPDSDDDGVPDGADNCRLTANPTQLDTNSDGQGDACDNDADGDGLSNSQEDDYGTNRLLADTDGDGLGDLTEINLGSNPLVKDTDGDGLQDGSDNCPVNANTIQTDTDADGQGNVCDADDDGDGVADGADNCPLTANTDQEDTDTDGAGDVCDDDLDGDGVVNVLDNCPYVSNPAQAATNSDSDSIYAACDLDDTDARVGAKENGIFVDGAHGSDSNNGKLNSPLASLAAGIAAGLSAGKDVYVAAGTYDVSSITWPGNLEIFGGFENSDTAADRFSSRNVRSTAVNYKTTLTSSSLDVSVAPTSVSGLVLGGFHMENADPSVDPIFGARSVEISGGSVTLDRNTISGNSISARSTGLAAIASAQVTLIRNKISGGSSGLAGSESIGVQLNNASGNIFNNIIRAGNGRFATGIVLETSSPLLVNNTVDGRSGSTAVGTANSLIVDSSSPTVANNLFFTANAPDQYVLECRGTSPTASTEFSNNLLAVFPQDTPNPLVRDCDGTLYYDAGFSVGAAAIADNIVYSASDNVSDLVDASYGLVGGGSNDGVNDGLNTDSVDYGNVTDDYNGSARPQAGNNDIGSIER
ncbi:MAG: thrombospondin type 3 repeat-containing protein [Pseudomonadota bacterium]